jgi:DNA-directed RNA polymerase beta' subunit
VRFAERILFSGRTVITPGRELRYDEVGLPDETAWTLFGPLVARELGDAREVARRTERAARALDKVMACSWVACHRAPSMILMWAHASLLPTAMLAFRPKRCPGNAFRFHPLATRAMNADFDGDQMAVFLPITEGGQRDAAEKLSMAGHVARDPSLAGMMAPMHEGLWGLASLSLTPEGLNEVSKLAGIEVSAPEGFVTGESLARAMAALLERDGPEKTLEAMERLLRKGFEATRQSGASISPFIGESVTMPPAPRTDDPDAWEVYKDEANERIISRRDFGSDDLGPQLLAVKSGARGSMTHLACLVGARHVVADADGTPRVVRSTLSEGLSWQELLTCAVGARKGLGQTALNVSSSGLEVRRQELPRGFNVLARAVRSDRPGIVFASAAAAGEVDPLTDLDARLFVGLGPLTAPEARPPRR